MKNLDCNQIKIFINLKIIGQKDKDKKKIYLIFFPFTFFKETQEKKIHQDQDGVN